MNFDAYWVFHLDRDKERNHAQHYDKGEMPSPLPASRARLQRVE